MVVFDGEKEAKKRRKTTLGKGNMKIAYAIRATGQIDCYGYLFVLSAFFAIHCTYSCISINGQFDWNALKKLHA